MAYTPIPKGTSDWDVPVNAAFVDQDDRISAADVVNGQQWFEITTNRDDITALQAQGSTSLGAHVPPNWGQFWRPKRDNAGAVAAKVMAIGDSITQGYYCSNLKTTSWVGRMRTSLQAAHGNGGTGMFSVSSTQAILAVDAGVAADWTANGSLATTTGSPTTGIGFGPGISHLRFTAAGTITFTGVRGTSVRLWYITGGAPRAAWQYSIDGGAAVNVSAVVGATTIANIDVTGLADTTHTVVITWNGAPADVLDFIGVAGFKATGVVVDNMGRSGTNVSTAQWGNTSALTIPWNGGVSNPTDLAIVALGVNDATLIAEAPDVWLNGMATVLNTIKLANNGATDIILVNQHFGSLTGSGLYTQYSARIRDLADNYNAALVNMWTIGRNSWDYWNSLGYWGTGTSPAGASGTNSVHPSDLGHQFIADAITPIVLS